MVLENSSYLVKRPSTMLFHMALVFYMLIYIMSILSIFIFNYYIKIKS